MFYGSFLLCGIFKLCGNKEQKLAIAQREEISKESDWPSKLFQKAYVWVSTNLIFLNSFFFFFILFVKKNYRIKLYYLALFAFFSPL